MRVLGLVICWRAAWATALPAYAAPASWTKTSANSATGTMGTVTKAQQPLGMTFDLLADGNVKVASNVAPTIGNTVATGVRMSAQLPWEKLMRGAVKIVPGIHTAIVLAELADILGRCRIDTQHVGWECDLGTTETTGGGTVSGLRFAQWTPGGTFVGTWLGGDFVNVQAAAEDARSKLKVQLTCNSGSGNYFVQVTPGAIQYDGPTGFRFQSIPAAAPCGSGSSSNYRYGTSVQVQVPVTCANGGPKRWFDDKCDTGIFSPQTEGQVGDKLTAKHPSVWNPHTLKDPEDLAEEGWDRGQDFSDDIQGIGAEGPSSVTGQPTTTQTPQGTTTSTPEYTIIYNGPTITWNTTITTINPDGSTTTTTNAPPTQEIITCGLPNTPPCKIDETGTPSGEDKNPEGEVDGLLADIKAIAQGTYDWPDMPTISWSFHLPSTCGVISIPQFAPFMTEVNICPFQDIFHEIMGVVWILGGLLGAISMFWRDQLHGL